MSASQKMRILQMQRAFLSVEKRSCQELQRHMLFFCWLLGVASVTCKSFFDPLIIAAINALLTADKTPRGSLDHLMF